MRKTPNNELERLSNEAFKEARKTPLVVVLDNVRSAYNVGSVFRTSDAFLVEKLYLCGITARPPHKDIRKTALGANETVDWQHIPETVSIVEELKGQGYTIIAIEQADEKVWLQDFEVKADTKYAVVFGHEVKGVSDAVMQMVDYCIEIPQFGTKHSLNISVSAGVVIWDFWKKMDVLG